MDLYSYIDRLEDRFDDPVALEQIRTEARADRALTEEDRQLVLERAGTYLADAQRAEGPFDVDTVPDDEEGVDAGAE